MFGACENMNAVSASGAGNLPGDAKTPVKKRAAGRKAVKTENVTVEAAERSALKREAYERLAPLKTAAGNIAEMVCGLSGDSELFISGGEEIKARKLDTKALKEFTSVIKEIGSVIRELYGIDSAEETEKEVIHIEFSPDMDDYTG